MKDLFFLLLVVFSSWAFISGAVANRRSGKQLRIQRPAVSFSAGTQKRQSCTSPKCQPNYKLTTKVNPTGGCPIVRCVKKKRNCPPTNCNPRSERKSYTGQTLANGCPEVLCVAIPKRAPRRGQGPCPAVSSCQDKPRAGFCLKPRSIKISGFKCQLCPHYVKCQKPKQTMKCPDLSRCPKANFNRGQCVIPRKEENNEGCKKCPIVTYKCNQIGGGNRNQLG